MAHNILNYERPEVYRAADLVTEESDELLSSVAPSKPQARTRKIRHVIAPFAQDQFELSNNTALKLPTINGPVSEYSIHHPGPLELTWAKSLKFVSSIEGCDVQKLLQDSFKIQGCYYVLPRFSQFRVQIFKDKENAEFPFIVELQRRSGDAFLTGLLFKSLREFFQATKENEETIPISPAVMSIYVRDDDCDAIFSIRAPSMDNPVKFEGLDLTRGFSDSTHWVDMLNTTVLETTRSASNALALAAQSETNIPHLLTNAEGIVKGLKNLFSYSQDTPTLFGCSVILNKLSTDHNFCLYCVENNVISTILNALFDWSGQGKRDVSSTQILLQLTHALENIRKSIGDKNWGHCLHQDPEALDILQPLLKNGSNLGQRLFQILFSDEFHNTTTTEDLGQN